MPDYYNLKVSPGQQLFLLFSLLYGQIRSRPGTVQLLQDPVIGSRARFIGCGLVIVPIYNRTDVGRYDGQLAKGHAAVGCSDHFQLQQGRVVISGITVAAEAEITHGIEDDAIVVFLNGLQHMGMTAPNDICTGIDDGVGQFLLGFRRPIAAFHSPVGRKDHQITSLFFQRGNGGDDFRLIQYIINRTVQTDSQSIFRGEDASEKK